MLKGSRNRRKILCNAFVLVTWAALLSVADGESTTNRRDEHRERARERARKTGFEQYEKIFSILQTTFLLAVAPLVFRFIHCLMTDPIFPLILKEMQLRARDLLHNKFGNLENLEGDDAEMMNESGRSRRH